MSLKENLRKLLSRKSSIPASVETPRKVSIDFYDLREASAAKERGVKPGYYLGVHPILSSELEDGMLLQKLSLFFFEKLKSEGLLEHSETRIPIDNKNEMFVDPALSWFFSPEGYFPDMQLLIVRADHADRDVAQTTIVKALRKK